MSFFKISENNRDHSKNQFYLEKPVIFFILNKNQVKIDKNRE